MVPSMPPQHRRIVIASSSGLPRERLESLRGLLAHAELIITGDAYEELRSALRGAHALIGCPRPLFDAALLTCGRKTLEWIHVPGAGCEEFLIPELVESPIVLTNGRIIQGPGVADHALALLLALTRNLHLVLRSAAHARSGEGMPRPVELRAKTAVVVGCGGIGMLIAERLTACGARVIGVDQEYVPMIRAFERVVAPSHLHEVLPLADVVIVAAPATGTTRKLFNAGAFRCMRPTAYFVNVCRGALADTDALVDALRTGCIRAAGLDVTDPEPLPDDHPLRSMPNVIVTPHIAGPSDQNRDRSFALIKENVMRFVQDQPLVNVVDKHRGY